MAHARCSAAVIVAASILVGACGTKAGTSSFVATADGGADAAGGGIDSGATSGGDSGPIFSTSDSGTNPKGDSGTPAPVPVVYAHSPFELYKLNPTTKAVTDIGPFTGGCTEVADIALDANSNAYVTSLLGSFYKLDLSNAACTHIADGNYPNSLSFVPKGTLDPNAEALVGYLGAQYVRIDPTTGALTTMGSLSGGYQSSGDIVSVINGGTFLTVNGNACGDCLFQIDPKTGDMIQNYGSVNHASVYGLAFWAGTAYGFDDAGEIFSISVQNGHIVTVDIPVPNPPVGLEFWGAGSTTAAPPTAPDGGGIPLQ